MTFGRPAASAMISRMAERGISAARCEARRTGTIAGWLLDIRVSSEAQQSGRFL